MSKVVLPNSPYQPGQPMMMVPYQQNWFDGMNIGGGVPPASSGFRFRNQLRNLENQRNMMPAIYGNSSISGPPTAGDISANQGAIDKEISDLKAARNSYVGAGVASAAPGILGQGFALFRNIQGLNKLKRTNREEYVPEELRAATAEAGQQARSAKVSDYANRMDELNRSANDANAVALATATNPAAAINAATRVQANKNAAINRIGAEGQQTQSGRRDRARSLSLNLGNVRNQIKRDFEAREAAQREAIVRNVAGLTESVGRGFLTAGM